MSTGVPSDSVRRRQVIAVVLVSVLVIGLGSVALWSVFRPRAEAPRQVVIEPAVETSASPAPTSTPAATESAEASTSAGDDASGPDPTPVKQRPQRVAFRSNGTIFYARTNGSDKQPIVGSRQGAFALSPDGETLALVTDGTLKLYNTSSRKPKTVGKAAQKAPVWAPDSSRVYYVRGAGSSAQVREVLANGTKDKAVHKGSLVAVSPDGALLVVAFGESDETPAPTKLAMRRLSEKFTEVDAPGPIQAVAATSGWALVGMTADGQATIMAFGPASPEGIALLGPPTDPIPTSWAALAVSPDQAHLAAASTGDDGYSKVSLIPLDGGEVKRVVSRYDQYVFGWERSGKRVLLMEGNSTQGEPMRLVSYDTDGITRRSIASQVTP